MKQAQERRLHVIPSQANFVMMETGRPVKQVIEYFKQRNILIGRPFPPMDAYARVSLSTPADMRAFWKAWDDL
jgi:histidinol-phosphate aminotransferase